MNPREVFVVDMHAAENADRHLLGGKAIGLVGLSKAGLRVPELCIVTTNAYTAFVRERREHEKSPRPDPDDFFLSPILGPKSLVNEEVIRQLEFHLDMMGVSLRDPESKYLGRSYVPALAVRSSATIEDSQTNSFAGAFYTALNVRSQKSLRGSILKCWASLGGRPLTRKYQLSQDSNSLSMAIVVQKMIAADVAGVAFSSIPERRGVVHIEAVWGLGKGVVDGVVNPDSIMVDPIAGRIDYRVGSKELKFVTVETNGTAREETTNQERHARCLSDEQVLSLGRGCRKAEEAFGFPLDIEWAQKDGEILYLQARPVVASRFRHPPH